MEAIKVSDLLNGLGVNFGNNCEKSVHKFNNAMRRYYSRVALTGLTQSEMYFQKGGIISLSSKYGELIYSVDGIYVHLSNCYNDEPCYRKEEKCGCDDLYTLMGSRTSGNELGLGEYRIDGNTIKINVGECATKGWITYVRGPKIIESLDEIIHIDSLEWEIIHMELLRFQHEQDRNFNGAAYFEDRSYKTIQSQKKMIDKIPHTIGSGFTA